MLPSLCCKMEESSLDVIEDITSEEMVVIKKEVTSDVPHEEISDSMIDSEMKKTITVSDQLPPNIDENSINIDNYHLIAENALAKIQEAAVNSATLKNGQEYIVENLSNAEAKSLEYCVKTEKTGSLHCLYRSLSLSMFGHRDRHAFVRKHIVSNVVNNWIHYSDLIARNYVEINNANEYREYMSRGYVQGGHLEIVVATRIFNIYVDLFNSYYRTVKRYGVDSSPSKKRVFLYFTPSKDTSDRSRFDAIRLNETVKRRFPKDEIKLEEDYPHVERQIDESRVVDTEIVDENSGISHSLFRSLSRSMFDRDDKQGDIRRNIITNVLNNWRLYKDLIVRDYRITEREDYKSYMSQNTVEGGDVEIIVATRIFNIYIDLFNTCDHTVKRFGDDSSRNKKRVLLHFTPSVDNGPCRFTNGLSPRSDEQDDSSDERFEEPEIEPTIPIKEDDTSNFDVPQESIATPQEQNKTDSCKRDISVVIVQHSSHVKNNYLTPLLDNFGFDDMPKYTASFYRSKNHPERPDDQQKESRDDGNRAKKKHKSN